MRDNPSDHHLTDPPPAPEPGPRATLPPYPAAPAGLPPPQPPWLRRRTGIAIAAAALLVLGGAGVSAYLMLTDQPESPLGAGPTSSADPSPSNQELTADEIYHTSPWPYDDTLPNGNTIRGELELIDTYDHPDCASAARSDPARQALDGCTQRLEAAYRGTLDGQVVSEQVLVFTDATAAAAFQAQFAETYPGEVVSFEDPENIQPDAAYTGGWTQVVGRYVVLSVTFGRTDTNLQQGGNDTAARQQETIEYLSTRR
jgi:hypothetical protein